MSAALLAVSAALLIVWAGAELRPPERRLTVRSRRSERQPLGLLLRIGNAVVVVANKRMPRVLSNLSESERRTVGLFVLLMFPSLMLHPLLGICIAVTGPALVWHRRRTTQAERRSEILRELPLMVELMSLLVGCGYNVTLALREMVPQLTGPLAHEIRAVLADVQRGERLADALDKLPARTCEEMRPFVWSLTSTERYGAPLGDVLDRLSLEARTFMANRAEQSVRKLTVQLLFPVAGTTLPAFALLTVAPFVVSSFRTMTSAFN